MHMHTSSLRALERLFKPPGSHRGTALIRLGSEHDARGWTVLVLDSTPTRAISGCSRHHAASLTASLAHRAQGRSDNGREPARPVRDRAGSGELSTSAN